MWPWNNEKIQTQREIQGLIPYFPYTITPEDTLDYRYVNFFFGIRDLSANFLESLMGYNYDTSTQLSVNSVSPVLVHLPSTQNERTYQIFPLYIQRSSRYLVAAKNTGKDHAHLGIQIYAEYERMFEHTFMEQGFQGESIEPEPDKDETNASTSCVWSLERGRYYVVVSAIVVEEGKVVQENPSISAKYEIGVATSLDFDMPNVPIQPGVIANPQVPQESCVYIANRRYAPIKLEAGRPQFRLTQMKGTHELFGINVYQSAGLVDVKFEVSDIRFQFTQKKCTY